MIASGLRIFDVRDPRNPVEVGYYNQPTVPDAADPAREGAYAMSAPAYDLKRRQVWYSDGNSGFYVVRLAKRIVPAPLLGLRRSAHDRRHLGPDAEQPHGAVLVEALQQRHGRRRDVVGLGGRRRPA